MLWAACFAWSSTKAEQKKKKHIKDQITMFSCHFESWSRCFVFISIFLFFYSLSSDCVLLLTEWTLTSCPSTVESFEWDRIDRKIAWILFNVWNFKDFSKISSISCLSIYIFLAHPQQNTKNFYLHWNKSTFKFITEAVPLNGNHIISSSMNQTGSMIRDFDFLRGWNYSL
jgi:hypothetical protein